MIMEENVNIEKMERKRFYALLIKTVAALLWTVFFIWQWWVIDFSVSTVDEIFFYCFLAVGVLFIGTVWWSASVLRKIKKDKRLQQALDTELYTLYEHKAIATGFCTALIVGMFLFSVSLVIDIPASLAAFFVAAAAGFASEIRRLILYWHKRKGMKEKELMNRIEAYRNVKGISQEELAVAIGVTHKTIKAVESGDFIPSVILALKIANYFEVPVEKVFYVLETPDFYT